MNNRIEETENDEAELKPFAFISYKDATALSCVMNLNAKRQSFNGFYFFYKSDKTPNTLLFEL